MIGAQTGERWAVIGIDPSLTSTGVAVITDRTITTRAVPSTRAAGSTTVLHRLQRIAQVTGAVVDMAPRQTRLVVIEAPAYDSRTGHQHDRSGLWWSLVTRFAARGLPVVEVTTGGRAKYATGKGNASKDAVLAAVVRRYLQVEVTGNDVADALVLAAMGARALGQPIDNPPALNLAAMDAVAWPAGIEVRS